MVNENIICFSGGKDSTAMLLRMIELNYKIDRIIFADTTLEYPNTYIWIKKIETIINHKIEILSPKKSFDHWFYGEFTKGKYKGLRRGFPYIITKCYWSRESKFNPLTKAQGKGNNIFIGIAKDEEKRSYAKQYIYKPNKFYFPLIDWGWSEEDCFIYLKNKGLEHPLRYRFNRSGCWLCPKQSKKSLYSLYKYYPELWNKLLEYDKDSPHQFNHHFKLSDLEIEFKKI
jgi:3'-phosphoadenosine 5'-phosphosulfate sulfotransferase (PAPS reductase)/FAD synthetase